MMPAQSRIYADTGTIPHDRVLGLFFPALGLVSYNFDWRKYSEITGPIANNRELVEEHGTIFHEIYHYLQLISTTYCQYLFALEQSKARAYHDLISYFGNRLKPRRACLPFWAYLNLESSDKNLSLRERRFRDTRFQHGNAAQIVQELLQKGSRIPGLDLPAAEMVLKYATEGLKCDTGTSDALSCSVGGSFAHEIQITGPVSAGDEVGVPISGEMLLENAAFVISTYPFWHVDAGNSTALVLDTIQHYGNAFYTRLIELTARQLQIQEAHVLKNTFLALAHLALMPPAVLGSSGKSCIIDWTDFHPGWRFLRALDAARRVRPISHHPTDYDHFVGQICRRLNWVTPQQVASRLCKVAAPTPKASPAKAWIDQEFARVLPDLAKQPWQFFDPGDELFLATEWSAKNFPPMVDDPACGNVILTRHEDLGVKTIDWYLTSKLPQQIMLGASANIPVKGLSALGIDEILSKRIRRYGLARASWRSMRPLEVSGAYTRYVKRKKCYSPWRSPRANLFF